MLSKKQKPREGLHIYKKKMRDFSSYYYLHNYSDLLQSFLVFLFYQEFIRFWEEKLDERQCCDGGMGLFCQDVLDLKYRQLSKNRVEQSITRHRLYFSNINNRLQPQILLKHIIARKPAQIYFFQIKNSIPLKSYLNQFLKIYVYVQLSANKFFFFAFFLFIQVNSTLLKHSFFSQILLNPINRKSLLQNAQQLAIFDNAFKFSIFLSFRSFFLFSFSFLGHLFLLYQNNSYHLCNQLLLYLNIEIYVVDLLLVSEQEFLCTFLNKFDEFWHESRILNDF